MIQRIIKNRNYITFFFFCHFKISARKNEDKSINTSSSEEVVSQEFMDKFKKLLVAKEKGGVKVVVSDFNSTATLDRFI